MTIHETVKNHIKDAMRAKDQDKLDALRGLVTLFANELIAKKSPAEYIDDESALVLVRRAVKQRKEAIAEYEKGGRKDLVGKEKAELKVLSVYLPAQMSEEEVRKFAETKLAGADKSDKSKGVQLVGMVMKELKGKADGALVKKVVDEIVKG